MAGKSMLPFCWIIIFCFTSFSTSHYTRDVTGTSFSMWDLDAKDTLSYVTFVVASGAFLLYLTVTTFYIIGLFVGKFYMYHPSGRSELGDALPGVSIIKPLMGVDPLLEYNLESHFKLTYPKFELLFCFHDDQDAAIPVVHKLHEQYPHVDVKTFIGGNKSIINPMVQNMAPAYEKAQYEYVWISSSRVEASDEIIYDLASKLQKSNVSLVHQMPFTTDGTGFGSTVEKIYFGSYMSKFYISFNTLGLLCVTGMSYMFKKALLDQANGLAWYGKYLAEDYFLTQALHERGRMLMSAIPAKQNVGGEVTVTEFVDRMVRWVRLRLNMMPAVTGVLEPFTDCFPMGIYMSLSMYYFFAVNPFMFFLVHVIAWLVMDYVMLKTIQNGPIPFSKLEYVLAWVVRELTGTYVFILAVCNPHYIKWGRRTYRVNTGGLTEIVDEKKTKKLQQL